MGNERQDFSRRLADAMRAKGYAPRPGVLHKLFNSKYAGDSVAFSTASKWLRGMAFPEQDKLRVLAMLFAVEPHVLRFGTKHRIAEPRDNWPDASSAQDHAMLSSYLALSSAQRKLVRELVAALGGVAQKG